MAEQTGFEETIERIRRMEHYFDVLRTAAAEDASAIRNEAPLRQMLSTLAAYYEGGQWLSDYTLDEEGLLPADLKRGVLSQDGVYDLLLRLEEEKTADSL